MNVLELIKASAGWLSQKGIESPRLNAEHLLAKVLNCGRMDLYLRFDSSVEEPEKEELRLLIKKRASGIPLQHLLGSWDFFGRTFHTDARGLVPRPETELLVERVLACLPGQSPLSVLDCGTGSGVIALTLAAERAIWEITATDISSDALSLARENQDLLGLSEQVCFWEGDLLPKEGKWHAIVANLPYIPSADLPNLPPEVLQDPAMALDGGSAGLDLIGRLIEIAPAQLEEEGWLFLEFGQGQDSEIESLLVERGFRNMLIHKDHQGIPRVAETRL